MTDQESGVRDDEPKAGEAVVAVPPFLLGAAAGGLAGVAAALLLTGPTRALAQAIARRFGRGGDGLRFELLLQ